MLGKCRIISYVATTHHSTPWGDVHVAAGEINAIYEGLKYGAGGLVKRVSAVCRTTKVAPVAAGTKTDSPLRLNGFRTPLARCDHTAAPKSYTWYQV